LREASDVERKDMIVFSDRTTTDLAELAWPASFAPDLGYNIEVLIER